MSCGWAIVVPYVQCKVTLQYPGPYAVEFREVTKSEKGVFIPIQTHSLLLRKLHTYTCH